MEKARCVQGCLIHSSAVWRAVSTLPREPRKQLKWLGKDCFLTYQHEKIGVIGTYSREEQSSDCGLKKTFTRIYPECPFQWTRVIVLWKVQGQWVRQGTDSDGPVAVPAKENCRENSKCQLATGWTIVLYSVKNGGVGCQKVNPYKVENRGLALFYVVSSIPEEELTSSTSRKSVPSDDTSLLHSWGLSNNSHPNILIPVSYQHLLGLTRDLRTQKGISGT